MKSDYIFETSWEICNKIGGIYTVMSTKAGSMVDAYGDHYVLTGPDVWKETHANPDFLEDHNLFSDWKKMRSEEHTSELQSHSFISYAVFCLKKKKTSNS